MTFSRTSHVLRGFYRSSLGYIARANLQTKR